jgi:hypothetical protein
MKKTFKKEACGLVLLEPISKVPKEKCQCFIDSRGAGTRLQVVESKSHIT